MEDEQFIEPMKRIDLCTEIKARLEKGAGAALGVETTPKAGSTSTPHKSHYSSQFIYRLRSEKRLNREIEGMT